MAIPEAPGSQPERDDTNESLRTERSSADQVLDLRLQAIEACADDTLELARERADATLSTARERADRVLSESESEAGGPEHAAVNRVRLREDESLQRERDAADETLERERTEQTSTLRSLLPLEREQTNQHLLTERARSDGRLASRDDFLGMVSHDLRSLLCGVVLEMGRLEGAASDSAEGKRCAAAARSIERYVARMNGLLGDLVDVVSIDSGRLAVRPVASDAAQLLAEAVGTFAGAAANKGIGLCLEPVASELRVPIDHARLFQVMTNLLTNALKFTARGGEIFVRGEATSTGILISVRDTGKGIPAAQLTSVFERFWQVAPNESPGLGLGLYISKSIVDAHHGRIWAESTPGSGSVFFVALPKAAPLPADAA